MAKNQRIRSKLCATCGEKNDIMFRIKTSKFESWKIVCPSCQTKFKNETGYQYGGTWKAVKRH